MGLTRVTLAAVLAARAMLAQAPPAPVAEQTPAPKPNAAALDLAQAAEAKSAEWATLAQGLEQRVARLLPCDARVRSAVEEVSRASDARFSALAAYWQDAAAQSHEQALAATKLLADSDARLLTIRADRIDADDEQAFTSQQFENLRKSAAQQWALSDAVNALGPIARAKHDAAARAVEREKLAQQSKTSLMEIARTADARQAAIEKERQALTTEGNRWREYYAVRIARAQTECQLTGASADPAPKPAATKPATGKKGR